MMAEAAAGGGNGVAEEEDVAEEGEESWKRREARDETARWEVKTSAEIGLDPVDEGAEEREERQEERKVSKGSKSGVVIKGGM